MKIAVDISDPRGGFKYDSFPMPEEIEDYVRRMREHGYHVVVRVREDEEL
jgi:hypothetical protein